MSISTRILAQVRYNKQKSIIWRKPLQFERERVIIRASVKFVGGVAVLCAPFVLRTANDFYLTIKYRPYRVPYA
jgi:hypothetical protein